MSDRDTVPTPSEAADSEVVSVSSHSPSISWRLREMCDDASDLGAIISAFTSLESMRRSAIDSDWYVGYSVQMDAFTTALASAMRRTSSTKMAHSPRRQQHDQQTQCDSEVPPQSSTKAHAPAQPPRQQEEDVNGVHFTSDKALMCAKCVDIVSLHVPHAPNEERRRRNAPSRSHANGATLPHADETTGLLSGRSVWDALQYPRHAPPSSIIAESGPYMNERPALVLPHANHSPLSSTACSSSNGGVAVPARENGAHTSNEVEGNGFGLSHSEEAEEREWETWEVLQIRLRVWIHHTALLLLVLLSLFTSMWRTLPVLVLHATPMTFALASVHAWAFALCTLLIAFFPRPLLTAPHIVCLTAALLLAVSGCVTPLVWPWLWLFLHAFALSIWGAMLLFFLCVELGPHTGVVAMLLLSVMAWLAANAVPPSAEADPISGGVWNGRHLRVTMATPFLAAAMGVMLPPSRCQRVAALLSRQIGPNSILGEWKYVEVGFALRATACGMLLSIFATTILHRAGHVGHGVLGAVREKNGVYAVLLWALFALPMGLVPSFGALVRVAESGPSAVGVAGTFLLSVKGGASIWPHSAWPSAICGVSMALALAGVLRSLVAMPASHSAASPALLVLVLCAVCVASRLAATALALTRWHGMEEWYVCVGIGWVAVGLQWSALFWVCARRTSGVDATK